MPLNTTSPYFKIDLVSDFIGHWKLDEASGDALDNTGNNYTMTSVGGGKSYSQSGLINTGTSIQFPGGSGLIGFLRDDDSAFNLTTKITLISWFSTSYSSDTQYILARDKLGTSTHVWHVLLNPAGTIEFAVWNQSNTKFTTTTTTTWNDGSPHLVACTWDFNGDLKQRIYVDGSLDTTGTPTTNTLRNTPKSTTIGHIDAPIFGWDSKVFTGFLDDIRIYNRALSKVDISALYVQNKI